MVSIITPSYNSEAFIKETINSVLSQSYKRWEMIIVDDSSSDKSLSIIKTFIERDKRIKLIQNIQNMGVAKSRNRAIKEAKGEYIALLDADDVWLPHKLATQISLMQEHNILVSYSTYYTINQESKTIGLFQTKPKVTYHDLLKTSTIGTLTMIYNVKQLGKFYFEEIGHEDYLYKLNILKQVPFAIGIQAPLAHYRLSAKSLSSNKIKASLWQWKIYRTHEKLSLLQSLYYFFHYTYHGIFKYR